MVTVNRLPGVLSQKFVHKFDAIHGGFPTVAAVYDRRFSLQHAIKPAVTDRRYSGKMVPTMSARIKLRADRCFLRQELLGSGEESPHVPGRFIGHLLLRDVPGPGVDD